MTISCKRTKRGSTEGETNGIVNYAVEVYEVSGLPVTSGAPLSDLQIVLYAQQGTSLPNPLPSLSDPQPITGLSLKRWRVNRKASSRSRATITIQYGQSRGFGPSETTRQTRTRDLGTVRVQIPYWIDRSITLPAGLAGPTLEIFETGVTYRYLGQYEILYGRLQDNSYDPILARQISIQNKMKLYTIDGLPFLHNGIDDQEMRDGRYWVWTKYMSTGVISGTAANAIIDGSQEIEPLGVLEEYKLDVDAKTTVARPVTELYEAGGTLGWAQ